MYRKIILFVILALVLFPLIGGDIPQTQGFQFILEFEKIGVSSFGLYSDVNRTTPLKSLNLGWVDTTDGMVSANFYIGWVLYGDISDYSVKIETADSTESRNSDGFALSTKEDGSTGANIIGLNYNISITGDSNGIIVSEENRDKKISPEYRTCTFSLNDEKTTGSKLVTLTLNAPKDGYMTNLASEYRGSIIATLITEE